MREKGVINRNTLRILSGTLMRKFTGEPCDCSCSQLSALWNKKHKLTRKLRWMTPERGEGSIETVTIQTIAQEKKRAKNLSPIL